MPVLPCISLLQEASRFFRHTAHTARAVRELESHTSRIRREPCSLGVARGPVGVSLPLQGAPQRLGSPRELKPTMLERAKPVASIEPLLPLPYSSALSNFTLQFQALLGLRDKQASISFVRASCGRGLLVSSSASTIESIA